MSLDEDKNGERGAALVAVLWFVVALSLMAAVVLSSVRQQSKVAHSQKQLQQLKYAAEGGVYSFVNKLLNTRSNLQGELISSGLSYEASGISISVKAELDNQLLNINKADQATLEKLFEKLAVGGADGQRLAAAIVDWRDRDKVPTRNGFEGEYEDVRPANRPMETLGELLMVKGMTREIYTCLLPHISLYSNVVQLPTMGGDKSSPNRGVLLGNRGVIGDPIWITSTVTASDLSLSLNAVVRITGKREKPFVVHQWITGNASKGAEDQACGPSE